MSTFWLKIAAVVVVVVVVIIVLSAVLPSGSKPEPKQKTIYQVWEEDDKRLRATPQPPQVAEVNRAPVATGGVPTPQKVEPAAPLEFEKLPLEEEVQAQKLYELALFHRKKARLPVMGYKQMVDCCRQIIRNWPKSEYAYKAKLMLRDMPEQYREMYNVTAEEIGS